MSTTENGSQPLLRTDQLAEGRIDCVTHAGQPVVLCRVQGQVHAVSGICPHEEVSLCQGALAGHRLRCPLHGSEFDVRTGQVLSEPAEQNLTRFEVVERDGWIVLQG